MKDLEWYLDLRGSKTGPFTAKDIVEMFKAGKVQGTHKATAERLHGEWITVEELVSAFKELNKAPKSPWKGDFNPPPRPTEQIEVASHTHYSEADQEYDPTASLFQAIRNLKDRTATQPKNSISHENTHREESRTNQNSFSPQAVLVSVLGLLILGAAFAMWQIVKTNSQSTAGTSDPQKKEEPLTAKESPPPSLDPSKRNSESRLLTDGGAPARTRAPVNMGSSTSASNNSRNQNSNDNQNDSNPSGGAMYENELSPEVMAEMQAAQDQDHAATNENDPARRPGSKRKKPPVPAQPPEDDLQEVSPEVDEEAGDLSGFDQGVAPDTN
jgi:hypothetical protein